jgi:hypothetical protein
MLSTLLEQLMIVLRVSGHYLVKYSGGPCPVVLLLSNYDPIIVLHCYYIDAVSMKLGITFLLIMINYNSLGLASCLILLGSLIPRTLLENDV